MANRHHHHQRQKQEQPVNKRKGREKNNTGFHWGLHNTNYQCLPRASPGLKMILCRCRVDSSSPQTRESTRSRAMEWKGHRDTYVQQKPTHTLPKYCCIHKKEGNMGRRNNSNLGGRHDPKLLWRVLQTASHKSLRASPCDRVWLRLLTIQHPPKLAARKNDHELWVPQQ